jgi:type II secretory pathway pseudopilin PulG
MEINSKLKIVKNYFKSNQSFTLVEILIVLALIAVLGIAIALTLNPQEMIKRGRDSTRLADLANLHKTISWYISDTGGTGPTGSSSVVYVSIPDSTSTCANLGLPALPSGWSYRCVTSSTLQKTDGTGWIPIDFTKISFGKTIQKLPIDPINTTSSGNYYTYVTGGSYKLGARFESQKYVLAHTAIDGGTDPALYEVGTDLVLAPFVGGLVGYWPFDEGSGTTAYDYSGYNRNASLCETLVSNCGVQGPTWISGKSGNALSFDGINDGALFSYSSPNNRSHSMVAWINYLIATTSVKYILAANGGIGTFAVQNSGKLSYSACGGTCNWGAITNSVVIPTNQWKFVAQSTTYDANGNGKTDLYVDGTKVASATFYCGSNCYVRAGGIGMANYDGNNYPISWWNGYIDDVRVYNRALSDAEIQAIYNATK